MQLDYGVRWRQWGKGDRLETKEKFFRTNAQRERFVRKLEDGDRLHELVAWCDPDASPETETQDA